MSTGGSRQRDERGEDGSPGAPRVSAGRRPPVYTSGFSLISWRMRAVDVDLTPILLEGKVATSLIQRQASGTQGQQWTKRRREGLRDGTLGPLSTS